MGNLTYKSEFPQRLYHYCSTENFLKIIGEKQFRVCNIIKSNDCKEIEFLVPLIRKKIEITIKQEFDEEMATKLISILNELIDKTVNDFAKNVYALCFSETEDSLNQWNMYANKGKGFAIGVNGNLLGHWAHNFKEEGWSFGKVHYIDALDNNRSGIICDAIRKIKIQMGRDVAVENILIAMVNNLFRDLAFYKSKDFSLEKEWRLVFEPRGGINRLKNLQAYTSHLKNIYDTNYAELSLKEVKYYSSINGADIKSYFNLSFEKAQNEIIKDIVIGPEMKLDEKDVDLLCFLYVSGYLLFAMGIKDYLRIKKSKTSYQGG